MKLVEPENAKPRRKRKRGKVLPVPCRERIGPQPGPQELFLGADEDVVFYGGAAGGGKTFGLLLDAARHKDVPDFGAVIFRRISPNIFNEGGLWDESEKMYPRLGATGIPTKKQWIFPSGSMVRFAHLERDTTVKAYHGAQIPYIGFDELTEFTGKQFWYMFTRNRSTTGLKAKIRATVNPDASSFVAKMIEWYIDPLSGYALDYRSGVTRWFIRVEDELVWADTRAELVAMHPEQLPISFTFIVSKLDDNPILTTSDPMYRAKLMAMTTVERERLLKGNWKIVAAAGLLFKREWFDIVDSAPLGMRTLRYWDLAATPQVGSNDPDYTVGVKCAMDDSGMIYILDVRRFRAAPTEVEANLLTTARQDGTRCEQYIEHDPGQAAKHQASYYIRKLAGYNCAAIPVSKDKVARANPVSAQAGPPGRHIKLLRGSWNEAYLTELENFPDGRYDDQVDGTSGGVGMLLQQSRFAHAVVPDSREGSGGKVRFKRGVINV